MENVVTVQIGTFPGRLDSYAVAEGTTFAEALAMANLTLGAEQELKVDGVVKTLNDVVDEDTSLIILTKRLKGAR